MKIGIMQPYFFPYIGYFQLISAVDRFVFYDDVNFIKQGWINRNRILCNNKPLMFSVPISNMSSFVKIHDTYIDLPQFSKWEKRYLKTLNQSYSKAKYFDTIYLGVRQLLRNKQYKTIAELAIESVFWVMNYLGIETEVIPTSRVYRNESLKKEERLLDICFKENSDIYINPIGGQKLYSKTFFKKNGIDLYFLESCIREYRQFDNSFVPGLSIIDVMMFNSVSKIRKMLNDTELI